jgi:glucose-1-phosphatase
LRHYPAAKFDLLLGLKGKYKTFALSNINEIHVNTIRQTINKQFGEVDLHPFFHQVYYSNEVGHRKPNKEIYEVLLQRENLNAAETFFVDDKIENVEAARKLGIQAYHLADREKLFELLQGLKII